MLELLFGFMVYDTVKTVNNNHKQEAKRKQLQQLRWKLNAPVTQGHTKKCICRLCVNRRNALTDEHNKLLAQG